MDATQYTLGLYEKALPGLPGVSRLSWEEALDATREAGFDRLEISIDESDKRLSRLSWPANQRLDLVRAQVNAGLPIRTMCLSGHRKYPFGSHDAATRERALEIMRQAIDLACDIGVRIIQLAGYDVYYEEGDETTRKYFIENLARSTEYAAAMGVMLGFETMETPFMDTISKIMAYVKQVNSPYLGVYPDLGNLTNACELYGLDVAGEIQSGGSSLFAMHLKETVPGVYRNMDFGMGRVNFAEGIKAAWVYGVRMYTAEFWHLPEHDALDWRARLTRTGQFLREQFNKIKFIF